MKEREKRKPEFENKWVLNNDRNAIQVNIWQSSHYRHGSDWDFDNYIVTLDGKVLHGHSHKWREFPGYDTKEEALKQK